MPKAQIALKKVQKNKRDRILRYLKRYQKRFKLTDIKFKILFVRGPEVKNYYAEVLMRGKKVRIKFNEDLMEQRPQEMQDTVIHELLHVLLYRLMTRILNIMIEGTHGPDCQKRQEEKLCGLEHEVIEKLVSAFIVKNKNKIREER